MSAPTPSGDHVHIDVRRHPSRPYTTEEVVRLFRKLRTMLVKYERRMPSGDRTRSKRWRAGTRRYRRERGTR